MTSRRISLAAALVGLLTALCLAATTALAIGNPVVVWTANGVPVATTNRTEATQKIVGDGDGGAIIAWEVYNGTNYDIYAQRVNSAGVAQWTTNGVAVCTAAGDQTNIQLASDGAGGAIIAWYDFRAGNGDIYAQRLNASGTAQWAANGAGVITLASEQYVDSGGDSMVSDGAGGVFIVWNDDRAGTRDDNYAQRLNASGVKQWTANGVLVSNRTDDKDQAKIVNDGAGGALVAWDGTGLFAQKLNSSGTLQWGAGGVQFLSAVDYFPNIMSDGAGGAFLTWTHEDSVTWTYDVYAQRLNAAGAIQWGTNGVAVTDIPRDQSGGSMVGDGAGGVIITWSDFRNYGTTSPDIYAQRLNAAGVPQWADDGVPVVTAVQQQTGPDVVGDGAGGIIVAWHDERSNPDPDNTCEECFDIYAQRLNGSGTPMWTPNGVVVSAAVDDQSSPEMVGDGAGGAIIAWEDSRSGGRRDIYAQRLADDSTPPTNPASPAVETHGAISGAWQAGVGDPSFTWSGASDNLSGVKGYYWAFSTDPAVTPTTWLTHTGAATATQSVDPSAVAGGTYYLRVKTRDNSGNESLPATLFTFKYDATAPANPTAPAIETHGVISGVWQTTVADPAFTWSGASDALSGVKGYYWGFSGNAALTPTTWLSHTGVVTAAQSVDPSAVSVGTTYLRVRTEDNAGNQSAPGTLFVFKYITATASMTDPNRPALVDPANVVETHGVTEGWQSVISDTAFAWTGPADPDSTQKPGIAGWNYRWQRGITDCVVSPMTMDSGFVTATNSPTNGGTYDAAPATMTGDYCLFLQTVDDASLVSDWQLARHFRYLGGADSDGDGIPDAVEGTGDADGDGIPNYLDVDGDGDGLLDQFEGTLDADGDDIPNYLDDDDDGDGLLTRYENADPNHDGNPADAADTDGDGIKDYLDTNDDGDYRLTKDENADPNGDGNPSDAVDTDGDGIPDYLDADDGFAMPDADGDAIPDVVECPSGAPCLDTDHDGTPDYLDTDSDGDGIPDAVEGTGDPDHDGILNYLDDDSDGDGKSDLVEGVGDVDGDGILNYLDADDGDGPLGDPDCDTILNQDEDVAGHLDADNDGTPNRAEADSDADGIPDSVEAGDSDINTPPVDTDHDGLPNFIDTDSDGDGISDLVEGTGDPDHDGIPNYLDDDSDGDGISDLVEGTGDPDHDGIPNYLDDDSDGDGIPDPIEGAGDPDHDGLPNFIDDDSDGDGIPDSAEGTGDTDGDGTPNYLDTDSDGDSIPDSTECPSQPCADSDGDGIPDYLEVRDPLSGGTLLYLPLILKAGSGSSTPVTTPTTGLSAPNLVVEQVVAGSDGAQVRIRNVGNQPAMGGFWVDLYLNPSSAPTHVNQTWQMLSAQGMAWGVTTPGVPLAAGQAITLTTYGDYYRPDQSSFTAPIAAGTQVYVQADSANTGTAYGAVRETHEISGTTYDNIAGPTASISNTILQISTVGTYAAGNYPAAAGLPSRPR